MAVEGSTRFRALIAAAALLLLLADGAWWSRAFSRGDIAGSELQISPLRVDGQEVLLSLVDVLAVGDASYTVRDGKKRFEVLGSPHGLSIGDEVYLRGIYRHGPQQIEENWREAAPDRKGKWVLGLLGLALTLVGAPIAFGLRRDGVVLRG